MQRQRLLGWLTGAISHGIWTLAFVITLAVLAFGFAFHAYTLTWETTILSADFFQRFVQITGALPALLGGKIFQSYDITLVIPGWEYLETPWGTWTLFGEMHLVSSTVFDIGVYLVVIGLVLDILRSLGSGLDAQIKDRKSVV